MLHTMKRTGFTIVELIITLSIMLILLSLAVVNLTSSQANGRDIERKTDIDTIANHMETFYKSGTNTSTSLGRYPSTAIFDTSSNSDKEKAIKTSIKTFFPYIDVDYDSVKTPGSKTVLSSFIPATNTIETIAGVSPQPTKDQYVYQPIQTNGSLCTTELQECRRYNLYYRTEVDNTIKKLSSKRQ
jgi:prepilin-type N-terminal cleavage/methylation domain-containing protein